MGFLFLEIPPEVEILRYPLQHRTQDTWSGHFFALALLCDGLPVTAGLLGLWLLALDTWLRTRAQKQRCPRATAPALRPHSSSAGLAASPLGEGQALPRCASPPAHTRPACKPS